MPTTYAHYSFGVKVLEELNYELRKSINNNIDLYNIGLHGPDILFYYKPLKANRINKLGNEIHANEAKLFFESAKDTIISADNYDKAFAYIAGFICHYMLDSKCHPYVRENEDKLSHNEIETEFDSMLIAKDSLNPMTFKPTFHLVPTGENAKCIYKFFPETRQEDILQSLKSMKFYLNLFVSLGALPSSFIKRVLKILGNSDKIDLIKKKNPKEECKYINEKLLNLFKEEITPTALLIEEYFNNIKTNMINDRFNKDFG